MELRLGVPRIAGLSRGQMYGQTPEDATDDGVLDGACKTGHVPSSCPPPTTPWKDASLLVGNLVSGAFRDALALLAPILRAIRATCLARRDGDDYRALRHMGLSRGHRVTCTEGARRRDGRGGREGLQKAKPPSDARLSTTPSVSFPRPSSRSDPWSERERACGRASDTWRRQGSLGNAPCALLFGRGPRRIAPRAFQDTAAAEMRRALAQQLKQRITGSPGC